MEKCLETTTAPTRRTPRLARLGAILAGVVALVVSHVDMPGTLPAAQAADVGTLYINTSAFGKTGTCVPGNDAYDALTVSTNTCSLGAALTYSNANPGMTVTLATDYAASIPAGTMAMIQPTTATSDYMNTSGYTTSSTTTVSGAYYLISAPATIDLQNKLGIKAISTAHIAILITGKDITVKNASQIQSGDTSFLIAAGTQNITIDGGRTMPMDNYYTMRFLEIQGGSYITFRNYTVGNLRNQTLAANNASAVFFSSKTTASYGNITIENVEFTTTRAVKSTTWTCTTNNSSECVNNAISIGANLNITYLTIDNCRFTNLRHDTAHPDAAIFGPYSYNAGSNVTGLSFTNNVITDSYSCSSVTAPPCALLQMPRVVGAATGPPDIIANNRFVNDPALGQLHAIQVSSARTNVLSNTFIQDNYFDGFTNAAVRLIAAGLVTAERNTFGPNTHSNPNGTLEETAANPTTPTAVTAMMTNDDTSSNYKYTTWRPTAVSVPTTSPEMTITAAPPVAGNPTGAVIPPQPVRLDAYWTATTKAEVYLGSYTVPSGSSTATFTVPVPPEAVGAGGTLRGNVRLQTQVIASLAQAASTQYSRWVPLTGQVILTTIDAMAPANGPVEGGQVLTLTGSRLLALDPGAVSVVFNGTDPCTSVTIVDDSTMTCVTPPSSRPGSLTGTVGVTVVVGGTALVSYPDGYTYWANGTLTMERQAWLGAASPPDYGTLTAPGHGGAITIPSGGVVAPGTTVTWTYTVTYHYLVNGQPYGGDGDLGLTLVEVTDDQFGPVCVLAEVYLNTPVGCAAAGTV